MKLNKLCVVLSVMLALPNSGAQEAVLKTLTDTITKKYLFPIRSEKSVTLSGRLGELRSNHLHTGIDIRTGSEIGWPVLATQSGYVYQAGVSRTGYGISLWLKHPDGNSSVYSHLDRYYGKFARAIRQRQYEAQENEFSFFFPPDALPVNQGDTIGFSGNTGFSQGPHLHFEIRNSQNEVLDPLNFFLSELADNTPPVVRKIAIQTFSIDARAEGRFGRIELPVLRTVEQGEVYYKAQPVRTQGKIGLQLLGYDVENALHFRYSISKIDVYVNDKKKFSQHIQRFPIKDSRKFYPMVFSSSANGALYNKLYKEDGNTYPFYPDSIGDGIIDMGAEPQQVKIILQDNFNNPTEVRLTLVPASQKLALKRVPLRASPLVPIGMYENILQLTVPKTSSPLELEVAKSLLKIPPTIQTEPHTTTYLYDLRKALPQGAKVNQRSFPINFNVWVPPGEDFTYQDSTLSVKFYKNSLYDTLHFSYQAVNSRQLLIGRYAPPLRDSVRVIYRSKDIKTGDKQAVYRMSGYPAYVGGIFRDGEVEFSATAWGKYKILTDIVPPTIVRLRKAPPYLIRFRVHDNLSGIAQYNFYVNDNWQPVIYDAKTSSIYWPAHGEYQGELKGKIKLSVTDRAGNTSVVTGTLL